ncbi:MAG: hypothetical protein HC812_11625 [Leptolyngbya sp. RL_3_1]|nr:hypothetical protein [Leptolyngbya sp. RL_3_1]
MSPKPPVPASFSTAQLEQLWRRWMTRWWWMTLGLWSTVGTTSLWSLRPTFEQLRAYFTWTAIRYGLAFNRPAAVGLGLCLGVTVALLVRESRHLVWGLNRRDRAQLTRSLHHSHRRP